MFSGGFRYKVTTASPGSSAFPTPHHAIAIGRSLPHKKISEPVSPKRDEMENPKPYRPKWPSYLAIKVSANHHNEEELAWYNKIVDARQIVSRLKEIIIEATVAKHKVDSELQRIDDEITMLNAKIVTPRAAEEMQQLQTYLQHCKDWESKITNETAICLKSMANCEKFIHAADRTEIDGHLMQKYFMVEGDEGTLKEFEQHGEEWMKEGNESANALRAVAREVMQNTYVIWHV